MGTRGGCALVGAPPEGLRCRGSPSTACVSPTHYFINWRSATCRRGDRQCSGAFVEDIRRSAQPKGPQRAEAFGEYRPRCGVQKQTRMPKKCRCHMLHGIQRVATGPHPAGPLPGLGADVHEPPCAQMHAMAPPLTICRLNTCSSFASWFLLQGSNPQAMQTAHRFVNSKKPHNRGLAASIRCADLHFTHNVDCCLAFASNALPQSQGRPSAGS